MGSSGFLEPFFSTCLLSDGLCFFRHPFSSSPDPTACSTFLFLMPSTVGAFPTKMPAVRILGRLGWLQELLFFVLLIVTLVLVRQNLEALRQLVDSVDRLLKRLRSC